MAGFCVSGNGHLDYVNDGNFGLAKRQVVSMLYGVTYLGLPGLYVTVQLAS
jgi:hypothetical protein